MATDGRRRGTPLRYRVLLNLVELASIQQSPEVEIGWEALRLGVALPKKGKSDLARALDAVAASGMISILGRTESDLRIAVKASLIPVLDPDERRSVAEDRHRRIILFRLSEARAHMGSAWLPQAIKPGSPGLESVKHEPIQRRFMGVGEREEDELEDLIRHLEAEGLLRVYDTGIFEFGCVLTPRGRQLCEDREKLFQEYCLLVSAGMDPTADVAIPPRYGLVDGGVVRSDTDLVEEEPSASTSEEDRLTEASGAKNEFFRSGDMWAIAYGGKAFHLKSSPGLQCLHFLIERAGAEVPIQELIQMLDGPAPLHTKRVAPSEENLRPRDDLGDGGEIVDRRTIEAAQIELRRLHELAERSSDEGETREICDQIEQIESYLRGVLNVHGRIRRDTPRLNSWRARISGCTERAYKKIGTHSRDLEAHLRASVQRGNICRYSPERAAQWKTTPDEES